MNTSDQRAAQLLQQGHLQQAIAAYQTIVRERPHAADAWYNLGYLFRRTGDIPAALQAYAQALACGAAAPEQVHLNRAVLLSEHLGDAAAALQELELALHCRPAYPPALLNLGNLHEELGARGHAIAAYSQLLAIAPADPATQALQLQAAASGPTHRCRRPAHDWPDAGRLCARTGSAAYGDRAACTSPCLRPSWPASACIRYGYRCQPARLCARNHIRPATHAAAFRRIDGHIRQRGCGICAAAACR
ncbi:hypothetical protein XFF6992_280092 [Xanthomonas citri pv. fuscans]|nr:hypothetical protein XFF6992_280092 [Xanthomonas citri pv. fuscans]SOO33015.1 hypothetical protein XFF6994_2570004 [Xanthomonas citri pv. fuscans]